MKTNYKIKNFRVFGEEGTNVKIAPLTILTGCNSSGKSSIAKSLLLLDSFLCKVSEDMRKKSPLRLGEYTMDFSEYPLNLLGRFDKVVNINSDSKEIEFKYDTENGFDVVLTFFSKNSDTLNRGYLKKLVIANDENEIFITENGKCNLNVLPLLPKYLNKKYDYYNDPDNYYSIENSKISNQTIKWSIDNDSLFRVPLLDIIGHIKKDEFWSQMNHLLEDTFAQNRGVKLLFEGISQEFSHSECKSFYDFFKLKEKEWLSRLSLNEDPFYNYPNTIWDLSSVDFNCLLSYEWWEDLTNNLDNNNEFITAINNVKIPFKLLLTTLIYIGELINLPIEKSFAEKIRKHKEWFIPRESFFNYYLWEDFVTNVKKELNIAISPFWSGNLSYVGSSRIDVKRLYTLDSNSDFTTLLKQYFNVRRDYVNRLEKLNSMSGFGKIKVKGDRKPAIEPYTINTFINKWIKAFNIGDAVSLKMDSEGLGVYIKLQKGSKTTLLADEGFGISQLFSILLEIETCILKRKSHPLVIEQTIIIEEPEIHLHPNFQSKLVDMFAEAMGKYGIHFIIETHSEYFIRRLQLRVAEKKIPIEDVSVIYVDDKSNAYDMGLRANGKFSRDFGPGFLDEADNTAIQLFELSLN